MSTQADNRRGGSHLAQMYGVGLMAFVQSTLQMTPVFLLAVAPAGLAFLTALIWLPQPSVSREA